MDPIVTIGILAAVGVAVDKIHKRRKKPKTHGSARWITISQATRKNFFHPKGFLISDYHRFVAVPVYADTNSNILTIAPPGSGKGATSIIPNAFRYNHVAMYEP